MPKQLFDVLPDLLEAEGENVAQPGYQPNRDPKMLAAEPNAQARFVAKHMVGKGAPRITDIDKSTLDDALFNATNIRRAVPDAGTNRHGHVPTPKDAQVYEDCTPAEQAARARQKQKKMQTQVDETHAEAAHVSARHDINYALDYRMKKQREIQPDPTKKGLATLHALVKPAPLSAAVKEDIVTEAITSGGKKVMPRKPASQSEVDPEAEIEAKHDRTLNRHGEAIKRSKAEVYHEGWEQDFGPDKSCIKSKTSMGMLCTEHDHRTGAIRHAWSEEGKK